MAEYKTCACCGETKPTTQFYRAAKSKDGRQSYCIQCTKNIIKISRAEKQLEATYQKLHQAEEHLRELTQ